MARPMPPLAPVTMAVLRPLMTSPGFLHRPLLQRPGIDAQLEPMVVATISFSAPRWIFCVEVSGTAGTKAT